MAIIVELSPSPCADVPVSQSALINGALVSDHFFERISRQFAIDHGILSQGGDATHERLAITEKTSPIAVLNTAARLERRIITQVVSPELLHQAIDVAYNRHHTAQCIPTATLLDESREPLEVLPQELPEEDLAKLLADTNQDLLTTDGKSPLVRFLDRLLFTAVTQGASDLHLQPTPDHLLVRMRIDGVLDHGRRVPLGTVRPLVSRIKVIGRMDVAERLLPQDGRTTLTLAGRSIDVRISTVPTAYGERVVMRLLDANRQLLTTESLGMPPQLAAEFVAASTRSSGIILVTGPTGSGKTTTLYATLRCLDAIERNIMTIEDPIEYELSSLGIPISQSQVNLRKGVSFANGLRHLLRQDPDVIMVGEIRDAETARIAIQASLTGHLVFSTLHTNDAPSAVTRLIDLGVEPYLVAASLSTVLAQRLVRTCCSACAGTGTDAQSASCSTCAGSGFKGRCAIFEMLPVDETIRGVLTRGGSLLELRNAARAAGMRTLAETGADLVATGRTTAAEVERVIHHG